MSNKFNLEEYIKDNLDFKKRYPNKCLTFLDAFGGAVADELRKCEIQCMLTTRPLLFKDGEEGQVAKKLVIEIDFGASVIQPHSSFEDQFAAVCADMIQENINGLMENS